MLSITHLISITLSAPLGILWLWDCLWNAQILENLIMFPVLGSIFASGLENSWQNPWLGLEVSANLILALGYYGIPLMLLYCVLQRRNVPSNYLTLLLLLFAVLQGSSYLSLIWVELDPSSNINVIVQGITAILAVAIASKGFPEIPKLLALPSLNQLALVNQVLQREINERKQAEATLKELNEELESRVEKRTSELQEILGQLKGEMQEREEAEIALRRSEARLMEQNRQLEFTLSELKMAQSQLIQSEKMSSLGQMVAGVAHEINNPVNFIYGNLSYVRDYTADLFSLLELYEEECTELTPALKEKIDEIDLEFVKIDLPQIVSSMNLGAERIQEIVKSLKNFSRLDEAEVKKADVHEGLDSTLMILHNRIKPRGNHPGIAIIKDYGSLPKIECYPGQLNQVFMNLLSNAIDALESSQEAGDREPSKPLAISIQTQQEKDWVKISIADNGPGMAQDVLAKLFDPFFTTKPVGKGTGLGLSISYQIIVDRHKGKLECCSEPGEGAKFILYIPLHQRIHSVKIEEPDEPYQLAV